MSEERQQWGSKLGFILAASGSAIGLGNIVFFSANAYKFGAGAFYLPYLVALFVIGIPVMILELGLGHHTRRAFPQSLHKIAGKGGEFVGWWGVINATCIVMYYVTILSWVVGMLIGSLLGTLWQPSQSVPAFGIESLDNPCGFFFNMLTNWRTLAFVVFVWLLNVVIVWRGTRSIEIAVKFFVPLMWVFMIVLIIRGVTLPNGIEGIYLLFTPNFKVIFDSVEVWQGAFSQIFFTLSLGFGIMTAYASYLPRKSDQVNNGITISLMNCGFEFIAGLAIFSLLFTFAITPKASTLSMMFFTVPKGIGRFPQGVPFFGFLFFTLLLMAGLSSSISLLEAFASALIDKFRFSRHKVVLIVGAITCAGSMLFALPPVVDKELAGDGTLGFTLLDLTDHWAFSYGLLLVGLVECLIIGWVFGAKRLRESINRSSAIQIGPWFDYLIKIVIPLMVGFVLIYSFVNECKSVLGNENYYSESFVREGLRWLPTAIPLIWIVATVGASLVFTFIKEYETEAEGSD